jgi:nucleoside-diphosphate-sugar epimerase
VEVVYHVAALSAPWGKASEFHGINAEGTRLVAEACLRETVKLLVYVSSPSVVFDGRDQVNVTENVPYPRRYLSVYSLTKKLGEDHVNAAHRHGLLTVIIRPKAIFGPGDTTLLPRLLDRARQGRLPRIGDGRNLVDLTYVDCVVDALLLCLTAPAAVGHTYTITNGEPVRLWELIALLLTRCGIDTRLRPLPYRLAYALGAAMEFGARVLGGEPALTRYIVAILGRKRHPALPDVPTLRELGYDAQFSQWTGLFVPAGTPDAVVTKLREAAKAAVSDATFQASLDKVETPIQYLDQPQFRAFWDADARKLAEVVKKIGKVE